MKAILVWILLISAAVYLSIFLHERSLNIKETTYYELWKEIQANNAKEAIIKDHEITLELYRPVDKKYYKIRAFYPQDYELIKILKEKGINFKYIPPADNTIWFWILNIIPFVLFILILLAFFRQAQSGSSQAFSFTKSRARMFSQDMPKVTFSDVAGIDEVKEELKEIVGFLKDRQKFIDMGARIPKGVLLIGPPGTGKTLLGRAIAGEAGVPFFYVSGSEFVEMFVGVGAARVRDLFEQAKRNAPCIIFIDEIDAVGRHRGAGLGGGHDEREQTLNQLLVEMDGFEVNSGVIVLAATNRPDILDPALQRPGRFDRQIFVGPPDLKGREEILKIHARNKKLSPDLQLSELAKRTPGFTGADLENMLNEAALIAVRKNKPYIELSDCEEAIEKVLMGPARKSIVMSDEERKITAYHEAGHAIVAKYTPYADPVKKISIVPRGPSLGQTWQAPEKDKYNYKKEELLSQIKVLLGGRAAEELILNVCTTGAENDLERATKIARSMVTQYGMSSLGLVSFEASREVFLGRDFVRERKYSEGTSRLIDLEVTKIINDCYNDVKNIINTYREKLILVAETLLQKEVITEEEFNSLLA
ncbi:MAG: ATP-dependent zinc metalloprotease FtsH [Candidatus Calescibacterium sp.]|nr:ATP-dependent zinc metalloprotease FtsH [Candidatus Calescibacterium sp.]MCX7972578.1 ATP-dependent zinc metalloprotease FtsH [bacterium]MDW8195787.1 ATP-dependent zinc metalloprotease FtsH [Candidatus Calescibacterium sp.]